MGRPMTPRGPASVTTPAAGPAARCAGSPSRWPALRPGRPTGPRRAPDRAGFGFRDDAPAARPLGRGTPSPSVPTTRRPSVPRTSPTTGPRRAAPRRPEPRRSAAASGSAAVRRASGPSPARLRCSRTRGSPAAARCTAGRLGRDASGTAAWAGSRCSTPRPDPGARRGRGVRRGPAPRPGGVRRPPHRPPPARRPAAPPRPGAARAPRRPASGSPSWRSRAQRRDHARHQRQTACCLSAGVSSTAWNSGQREKRHRLGAEERSSLRQSMTWQIAYMRIHELRDRWSGGVFWSQHGCGARARAASTVMSAIGAAAAGQAGDRFRFRSASAQQIW